jgi:hypothetical protein
MAIIKKLPYEQVLQCSEVWVSGRRMPRVVIKFIDPETCAKQKFSLVTPVSSLAHQDELDRRYIYL